MARVLVVDDDPLVRETIVSALQNAGHSALETSDGQRALDVLGREVFDLLITDILMPTVDGIELILSIRKRQPKLRILSISGGDRTGVPDYLEMSEKLGALMILPKPFTPKQLLRAVEAMLHMPAAPKDDKGEADQ